MRPAVAVVETAVDPTTGAGVRPLQPSSVEETEIDVPAPEIAEPEIVTPEIVTPGAELSSGARGLELPSGPGELPSTPGEGASPFPLGSPPLPTTLYAPGSVTINQEIIVAPTYIPFFGGLPVVGPTGHPQVPFFGQSFPALNPSVGLSQPLAPGAVGPTPVGVGRSPLR